MSWTHSQVVAEGWSSMVVYDPGSAVSRAVPTVLKVRRPSIPGFTSVADRAGLDDAWAREGQALNRLRGTEGVVQLLDVSEVEGAPAYRLLWAKGTPLADSHVGKPWSLSEVRRIMARVAAAVCRMHSSGWLHLDLNPSNVMFDRESESVTLLDLGASAPVGSHAHWSWPLGRHVFMAPEQLAVCAEHPGPERGPGADVHQLAFLAAFLLTGKHPFRSCGDEDYRFDYLPSVLMWSQLPGHAKVSFVSRARPDLPRWTIELLAVCADPLPERRMDVSAFARAMLKGAMT